MKTVSIRKSTNFILSVTLLGLFAVGVLTIVAFSAGFIDLTSEPQVQGETNTTGVPEVDASEHPEIDGEDLEREIFDKVNEKRETTGKEPFIQSERVRLIARLHSKDMVERDFFNHTNPDGQGSTERHQEYDGCEMPNENIAEWGPLPTTDIENISRVIVDGWSNSSAHNSIQMSDYYRVAGVGVHVTEEKELYVTMNFCREHPNA